MIKQDCSNGDKLTEEQPLTSRTIPSCLRNGSSTSSNPVGKNRVSFPEDERDLVTGYLEPPSPWDNVPLSPEDLVVVYEESCRKNGTTPLEQVIDQLKMCWQPSPSLDLSGHLDLASLEALEAVLRRVRFQTIRLQIRELEDDAAVALFDMLEYYESAAVLSLTCDSGLGLRGWQACSRMIKKAHCLEELDARGTALNEQVMPVLCRSLKVGSRLTALRLGRCGLSGRCLIVLAAALRLNSTLQELTISDNELVASDAVQLGSMLRVNNCLRFLDISNNDIQDVGCGHICEALSEQKGEGLEALVLWNTRLSSDSGKHLASVLASSSPLETLNIGQNRIGNQGLLHMRKEMSENSSLKQLGVQAAQITCEGAMTLADILSVNSELRRIDARSNHIAAAGLTALKKVLKSGASVDRLDLDDAHGVYQDLVEEIRQLCRLNEARAMVEEELENKGSSNLSRKISLTCETLLMRNQFETNNNLLAEPKRTGRLRSPEPSPIPSPSSSPVPSPSRHRFRVSRVSESSGSDFSTSPSSPVSSRFRVTLVEPSTVIASGNVNQIGFEIPHSVTDDSGFENPKSNDSVTSIPSPISLYVECNNSPSVKRKSESSTVLSEGGINQSKAEAEKERRRKISAPVSKPQSNLEKLLGLFHNPGSLFSSVTLSSEKEGAKKKECTNELKKTDNNCDSSEKGDLRNNERIINEDTKHLPQEDWECDWNSGSNTCREVPSIKLQTNINNTSTCQMSISGINDAVSSELHRESQSRNNNV